MHPRIKKFFESERGTTPIEWDSSEKVYIQHHCIYWHIDRWVTFPSFVVARLEEDGIKYCFMGKWYTESEMLRIIKLKAFI